MKHLIIYMCFVALCGCSLGKSMTSNFINCQCKIIDVKEFDNSFKFTALNEFGDTIFIVSTKNNYRNVIIEQSNRVYINQTYDFRLVQLRPRVLLPIRLGASFIVENDTILKIPSYNPQNFENENLPKVYFIHNVIGLYKID